MPTLTSDPLDILLAHDAWATRQLLEVCRGLSHEQFHQRFDIGLGSLHDNLSHVIGVLGRWSDRVAGKTPRPMLKAPPGMNVQTDDADRTADELLGILENWSAQLRAVAAESRQRGFDQTISVQWPGPGGKPTTYTLTHGAVFAHIATHNAHHRAQCLNMLRRLNTPGISDKLPDISVTEWQFVADSRAD
jgi:uncharacterized damage-inducible protein DinB